LQSEGSNIRKKQKVTEKYQFVFQTNHKRICLALPAQPKQQKQTNQTTKPNPQNKT
jgi:hypothetical protein